MAERTTSPCLIATAVIGIAFLGYSAYQHYKNRRINSLRVLKVDSSPLAKIKDDLLLSNLFLLAQKTFDQIMKEGRADEQTALTLYSLYKQATEGNADEFDRNKEKTKPERYAVWLQQVTKSESQAIKEYIILVGLCDKSFNGTVQGVASGTIKSIGIDQLPESNPFVKVVPTPKKPDDSEYENNLNKSEKRFYELYKEIEENKDEKKLLELVRSGEVKVTDVNKEGATPLLLAVDCNFSSETISELIDLGSDINARDADGMTSLHKSYWVENPDNFKLLLQKGADPQIKDNEGDSCASLAQDNRAFNQSIEEVLGPKLAVSMSQSQFEKDQAAKSEAASQ